VLHTKFQLIWPTGFNERRTPSDGKISHCLWQSDLKRNFLDVVCYTLFTECQLPLTRSSVIFASQGLRFGSPFSPPLADLEYILRIRTLIFHWLRLPVHVSNQKTFYTEHMLSTKCKQKWHRNALI
jgi:hypothetical protein